MKRLEFTKFSHKNNLHSSLQRGGSLAVYICNITFNNTEAITLLTEFIMSLQ